LFVHYERALERRLRTPLVPFSLMEHRSMRLGLALAIPFFASFGGFMFLYAVVTQSYLGLSALAAGATLAPLAAAFCAASLVTARAVVRYGRAVISVGAGLQAIGYSGLLVVLATTWPHPSVGAAIPALVVAGFGQGLVVSPLLRVILSEVPTQRAGAGAGVLATGQQTSLALGVALIGSLFSAFISVVGIKSSVLGVIGIVISTACVVAFASRRLPNPDGQAPEQKSVVRGDMLSVAEELSTDASGHPGEELVFEPV
jgi:MFS family permease